MRRKQLATKKRKNHRTIEQSRDRARDGVRASAVQAGLHTRGGRRTRTRSMGVELDDLQGKESNGGIALNERDE